MTTFKAHITSDLRTTSLVLTNVSTEEADDDVSVGWRGRIDWGGQGNGTAVGNEDDVDVEVDVEGEKKLVSVSVFD